MIREHGIKIYGYAIVSEVYYYIHRGNKIIGNDISNVNQGNWDLSDDVYGTGITCGSLYSIVDGNTVYCNTLMEHGISVCMHGTITNNHIIFTENMHSQFYGIYIQNSVNVPFSRNVLVSNNHIEGNGYSNTGGIAIVGGAEDIENVTVTENNIEDVSYFGINGDSGASHCDISHNIINVCYSGVRFDGDYNTISWNKIYGTTNDGMMLDNMDWSDVSHNLIKDSAAYGMDLYGTWTYTSISNNRVIDPTNDGIRFNTISSFSHMDISYNKVKCHWNDAIVLDNVDNSTISFNHLTNTNSYGMTENSDCSYNIFIGNNAEGSAGAWDMNGINSVNSTNLPAMT